MISAYKDYEDSDGNLTHYYEITGLDDQKCYYIQSRTGQAFPYGTEVYLDTISNTATIEQTQFPISNTFDKVLTVVNYQGFVIDCLDSNMGVYNLDNEIYLFGSGCLDLPIGISVTLFNLHLIPIRDTSWIFKLFGTSLKKLTHILVYCPAFSSFMEGSDEISYDVLIETRSNFWSLIYANQWAKTNLKEHEFLGFQLLDQLASVLFGDNNQFKNAKFIGHCEQCSYTEDFTDLTNLSNLKMLTSASELKESFHRIKSELLKSDSTTFSNQVLSKTSWLRNEIISGTVKRKNSVLFDVISDDKTISIYCHESAGFNPPEDSFIFIFNALQMVEIVPKLRCSDSWTTKAYLWMSPETRVWSSSGFFWAPKLDLKTLSGYISCKITRKYLIMKDFIDGKPAEVAVIHTESEKGPHYFYLNPLDKFYGILPESDGINSGILVLSHLIDEKCFQVSNEPFVLQSSNILPTISCSLNVDKHTILRGPLQVQINDLPYLSMISGLQFFSLKLRFYSLSFLSIELMCSKCKSQVESGKCLAHFEAFSPSLILSAIFDAADMNGTCTNVLIDRFSFLEFIFGLNSVFLDQLINFLKPSGKIKLNSDHFAFSNELKPAEDRPTLESMVAAMIPRVSRVFNCTFPSNMTNSALKPTNMEFCDPKLELINILKLF